MICRRLATRHPDPLRFHPSCLASLYTHPSRTMHDTVCQVSITCFLQSSGNEGAWSLGSNTGFLA